MSTVTHKLDPAAPSTFGTVDLTSAESFSYNLNSSEVILGTDGKKFAAAYNDDYYYSVTVDVADASLLPDLADCADLVLKCAPRTCGTDVGAAGTRLIFTFTGASMSSKAVNVGSGGTSTNSITFLVGALDGDDPLTVT